MAEAEIVRRLDRLIGILELAHRDQLQEVRDAIRSDKTYDEILTLTVEEIPAGALSKAVQQTTKQSPKTVQRRIADLIEMRALERTGVAASTKYKATGLI